MVQPHELLLPL